MPQLAAPAAAVKDSFLAALVEYRTEGGYGDLDPTVLASDEALRAYLHTLADEARPDAPRPPGIVMQTTLWWVHGTEYLGRLSIRHELTDKLRRIGGHIGYEVRPSARRQGHATAMLRAVLPIAADLGIAPALLTCDVENVASRTVIERAGGRLSDVREGKMQFWVPTI